MGSGQRRYGGTGDGEWGEGRGRGMWVQGSSKGRPAGARLATWGGGGSNTMIHPEGWEGGRRSVRGQVPFRPALWPLHRETAAGNAQQAQGGAVSAACQERWPGMTGKWEISILESGTHRMRGSEGGKGHIKAKRVNRET